MYDFSVTIAGTKFRFSSKYSHIHDICSAYLCDSSADEIKLSVSDEEIEKQKNLFDDEMPADACESACFHRKVAEELALRGTAAFHGAAVSYEGKAYLFTAPSGTGKSTHIKLWKNYIGRGVRIINGDKPILGIKDGELCVFSSPWAGKERWQKNTFAPLAAVCIIERSKVCTIRRANGAEFLSKLMQQIFLPSTPAGMTKTLELFDNLCKSVPVFVLGCDISEEAVKTSFEVMTGKSYDECKNGGVTDGE